MPRQPSLPSPTRTRENLMGNTATDGTQPHVTTTTAAQTRPATNATPHSPLTRPHSFIHAVLYSPRRREIGHSDVVTGVPARQIYELRIVDAGPVDENNAKALTVLMAVASVPFGGNADAPLEGKVTMRVVERRTGEVVFEMRDSPEIIHPLAQRVDADLDRLDADAFHDEWAFDGSG